MKKNLFAVVLVTLITVFSVLSVFAESECSAKFPDDQMLFKVSDLKAKYKWLTSAKTIQKDLAGYKESPYEYQENDLDSHKWGSSILLTQKIGEDYMVSYKFFFTEGLELIRTVVKVAALNPKCQPDADEITRLYNSFKQQLPIASCDEDLKAETAIANAARDFISGAWRSQICEYFITGRKANSKYPAEVTVDYWHFGTYTYQTLNKVDEAAFAEGQKDNTSFEIPASYSMPTEAEYTFDKKSADRFNQNVSQTYYDEDGNFVMVFQGCKSKIPQMEREVGINVENDSEN